MRKNKKTVAKSDFFRRIDWLIERLIFVRGKYTMESDFYLFVIMVMMGKQKHEMRWILKKMRGGGDLSSQ